MARVCTVCVHPDRAEIEAALVAGDPFRDIARRFAISKDASARHKTEHLPAALATSREARDVARADDLLGKVRALEIEARRIATKAEEAGDTRTALAAIRELTRIVELQAKLAGQLSDAPVVAVHVSGEWATLRARILDVLDRFPPARVAVLEAIAGDA